MESVESTKKTVGRARFYVVAVICLILGIGIWYFLTRGPIHESTVNPQATEPAIAHASSVKISADQLKQMADAQAEPLLAKLRESSGDPSLLAEIGKTYYQNHQFDMAAKYYEDSVRIKPDPAIFVKLGGAYHFNKDDEKAFGAWNRALRIDPGNPDALFNIGFVKLRNQGDSKAAIAAWEKLLRTNPNHPKRAQVEALIAQAKQHSEAPTAEKE
jgi:cytochrome c-type biogenesis protein CcmH/NrfG